MTNNPTPRRPRDLLPLIVLAVILIVVLAGWLVFPTIQRTISNQDCIASGHVNCG